MNRSGCYPERGALINALASAGALRVEAEDALARANTALRRRPKDRERIAEQRRCQERLAIRRTAETEARERLVKWETTCLCESEVDNPGPQLESCRWADAEHAEGSPL